MTKPSSTETGTGKDVKGVEIKPPNLVIYGLVWNTDLPQAIVNNQVVNIGDKVSGSEITDISAEGVEVLHQGKRFKILYK